MPRIRRILLPLLVLAVPLPAAAQQAGNVVAPPPPPREGTVGPEQLRDFSLGGNRQEAQPESQPAPRQTAPPATAPSTASPPASRTTAPPTSTSTTRLPPPARQQVQAPAEAATTSSAPAPAVTLDLPPATPAQPGFDSGASFDQPVAPPLPAPPAELAAAADTSRGLGWWPWLLAAIAVIGGGLYLWRNRDQNAGRGREPELAFAGVAAPPRGAASAPTPPVGRAPAPVPRPPVRPKSDPVPAPAEPAASGGIVSSRLRAWLDLDIRIREASLTEEELRVQIDVLVVNGGSMPARDLGVEAILLNAGSEQDREIGAFFARPQPEARAAPVLAPLEQIQLKTSIRLPRTAFKEYSAGGGTVLIPVIALNAAYRAGSGEGRTSAAFLLGRGTAESEKLGPLRTDQGPRQFSGLALRRLPLKVRR